MIHGLIGVRALVFPIIWKTVGVAHPCWIDDDVTCVPFSPIARDAKPQIGRRNGSMDGKADGKTNL